MQVKQIHDALSGEYTRVIKISERKVTANIKKMRRPRIVPDTTCSTQNAAETHALVRVLAASPTAHT